MDLINTPPHSISPQPREPLSSAVGAKKPYNAPEVLCWGTLEQLTQGTLNGTIDAGFGGSTGA